MSKLVGHFTLFSCTAEWPRSEGAPRRGVTYVYGAESNGQQDWKDETLVADWSRAFERAGGEDNEIAAKPTMIYVNGGLHYFHFGAANPEVWWEHRCSQYCPGLSVLPPLFMSTHIAVVRTRTLSCRSTFSIYLFTAQGAVGNA